VAYIPNSTDLAVLSVSDRLDLMDEIWASLVSSAESIPLPDWHLAEIRKRRAALATDGNRGRTADEVFTELQGFDTLTP
jgi:putative addiction module component (TIGR02574 family)